MKALQKSSVYKVINQIETFNKKVLAKIFRGYNGKADFQIWNYEFRQVIEFVGG